MNGRTEPDASRLAAFVERRIGKPLPGLELVTRALRGGLVSRSVLHVSARYSDETGQKSVTNFVVKHLDASEAREALIYEHLSGTGWRGLAPALLAVERARGRPTHLYLEAVVPTARWPWRDLKLAAGVLERLAHFHQTEASRVPPVHDWDYDAELCAAAQDTLAVAEQSRAEVPELRSSLPALRRLTRELPRVREQLLSLDVLPQTVLHGDVHPGNVLVRRRAGQHEPVLLDWARARLGSPLEDVSSWLQWLGFWEPTVRRKHDTLLGAYLSLRGLPVRPSRSVRNAYWLAGALNCLSGALKYHLDQALTPGISEHAKGAAVHALGDCLRVVRRANACW